MIYAPECDVCFMHIPKNAGQSIRNALARRTSLSFDALARDLNVTLAEAEAATEAGFDHATLGPIKPEHLPLATIEVHFPHVWDVLRQTRVFALARDPRDRFISALLQRMREFAGSGAIRADEPEVNEEAAKVCAWLEGNRASLDLDYIHFMPQHMYVAHAGQRLVQTLFPMHAMRGLEAWLNQEAGLDLSVSHDHARRQPKTWAKRLQPAARFAGHKLMPAALRRALHPIWVRSGVFSDAARGYDRIDLGDETERFIADFYKADFALFEEAQTFARAWTPDGRT
ncbi:MAG: hypothetical protein AAF748_01745 [Pseudomonadota bacterium]